MAVKKDKKGANETISINVRQLRGEKTYIMNFTHAKNPTQKNCRTWNLHIFHVEPFRFSLQWLPLKRLEENKTKQNTKFLPNHYMLT